MYIPSLFDVNFTVSLLFGESKETHTRVCVGVGIVVGVIVDSYRNRGEMLAVLPVQIITSVEYSVYPDSVTLIWCVPLETSGMVIGVVPLSVPSR